jgi:hypothetical protein
LLRKQRRRRGEAADQDDEDGFHDRGCVRLASISI